MIGIFQFAIVIALMACAASVYSGIYVFRRIKRKQPLSWKQILLALAPLLVLDGLVCLYYMISAGLSHSAHLLEADPVKCAAATAAIVVLPMLILIFFRPSD